MFTSLRDAAQAKLKEAMDNTTPAKLSSVLGGGAAASNQAVENGEAQAAESDEMRYLRMENDALKARLRGMDPNTADGGGEEEDVRAQLAAKTADHDRLLEKSKELMKRYKELKAAAAAAASQPPASPASPASPVPQAAQDELARLQRALQEATHRQQQEIAAEVLAVRRELEQKLAEERSRVSALEAAASSAEDAVVDTLQRKVNADSLELSSLRAEVASLLVPSSSSSMEGELEAAREETQRLRRELEEAARVHATALEQTKEEQAARMGELAAEGAEELAAAREQHQTQVDEMRAALDQAKEEAQSAAAASAASAGLEALEQQHQAEAEELRAALKHTKEEAQAAVASAEARVAELERELAASAAALKQEEAAAGADDAQLVAAREQETAELRAALAHTKEEAQAAEARVVELERQLSASAAAAAALEQTKEKDEARASADARVAELERELEAAAASATEAAVAALEQAKQDQDAASASADARILELERQLAAAAAAEDAGERRGEAALEQVREQHQAETDELRATLAHTEDKAQAAASAASAAEARVAQLELDLASAVEKTAAALKLQEDARVVASAAADADAGEAAEERANAELVAAREHQAECAELRAALQQAKEEEAAASAAAQARVAELERQLANAAAAALEEQEAASTSGAPEEAVDALQRQVNADSLELSSLRFEVASLLLRVPSLEEEEDKLQLQQAKQDQAAAAQARIGELERVLAAAKEQLETEAAELRAALAQAQEEAQAAATAAEARVDELERQLADAAAAALEQVKEEAAASAAAQARVVELERQLEAAVADAGAIAAAREQQYLAEAAELRAAQDEAQAAAATAAQARVDELERHLEAATAGAVEEVRLAKEQSTARVAELECELAAQRPSSSAAASDVALLQSALQCALLDGELLALELLSSSSASSILPLRIAQLEQELHAIEEQRNDYFARLRVAEETMTALGDKFASKQELAEQLELSLQEERLRVEETELRLVSEFAQTKLELQQAYETKSAQLEGTISMYQQEAEASTVACGGMQNQLRALQQEYGSKQNELDQLKTRTKQALTREHEEKTKLQDALQQAKRAVADAAKRELEQRVNSQQIADPNPDPNPAQFAQRLEEELELARAQHKQDLLLAKQQLDEEFAMLDERTHREHQQALAELKKELDRAKHDLAACLRESRVRKERAERLLAEHEQSIDKLTQQLRHDPSQALQEDLRQENAQYRALLVEKEQLVLRLEQDVSFQRHKLAEQQQQAGKPLGGRADSNANANALYLKNVLVSYMASTSAGEQLGMVKAIGQLAGFSAEDQQRVRQVLEQQNAQASGGVMSRMAEMWGGGGGDSASAAAAAAAVPPSPAAATPRVMKRVT